MKEHRSDSVLATDEFISGRPAPSMTGRRDAVVAADMWLSSLHSRALRNTAASSVNDDSRMKTLDSSVGGSLRQRRVADETLFELIGRLQSSRLDDQRCPMPTGGVTQISSPMKKNHSRSSSDEQVAVAAVHNFINSCVASGQSLPMVIPPELILPVTPNHSNEIHQQQQRASETSREDGMEAAADEALNNTAADASVSKYWTDGDGRDSRGRSRCTSTALDSHIDLQTEDLCSAHAAYRLHMVGHEHSNFSAVDANLGPLVISIRPGLSHAFAPFQLQRRDGHAEHRLEEREVVLFHSLASATHVVVRSCSGSTHHTIPPTFAHDVSKPWQTLKATHPELNVDCMTQLLYPRASQLIVAYDEHAVVTAFKFGLIYQRPGQFSEAQLLSNDRHSRAMDEFMSLLGKRVELRSHVGYRGGLDTKHGHTGTHSLYTTFERREVMFHVSTLLPTVGRNAVTADKGGGGDSNSSTTTSEPTSQEQLQKKRHIGNDIVAIVFQDMAPGDGQSDEASSTATLFCPSMMHSSFLHAFIVVQPTAPPASCMASTSVCSQSSNHLNKKRSATNRRQHHHQKQYQQLQQHCWYRVSVIARCDVPQFGPPLPDPPVFRGDRAFRDFLLAKLINAERACYRAHKFSMLLKRTRRTLLTNLVTELQHQTDLYTLSLRLGFKGGIDSATPDEGRNSINSNNSGKSSADASKVCSSVNNSNNGGDATHTNLLSSIKRVFGYATNSVPLPRQPPLSSSCNITLSPESATPNKRSPSIATVRGANDGSKHIHQSPQQIDHSKSVVDEPPAAPYSVLLSQSSQGTSTTSSSSLTVAIEPPSMLSFSSPSPSSSVSSSRSSSSVELNLDAGCGPAVIAFPNAPSAAAGTDKTTAGNGALHRYDNPAYRVVNPRRHATQSFAMRKQHQHQQHPNEGESAVATVALNPKGKLKRSKLFVEDDDVIRISQHCQDSGRSSDMSIMSDCQSFTSAGGRATLSTTQESQATFDSIICTPRRATKTGTSSSSSTGNCRDDNNHEVYTRRERLIAAAGVTATTTAPTSASAATLLPSSPLKTDDLVLDGSAVPSPPPCSMSTLFITPHLAEKAAAVVTGRQFSDDNISSASSCESSSVGNNSSIANTNSGSSDIQPSDLKRECCRRLVVKYDPFRSDTSSDRCPVAKKSQTAVSSNSNPFLIVSGKKVDLTSMSHRPRRPSSMDSISARVDSTYITGNMPSPLTALRPFRLMAPLKSVTDRSGFAINDKKSHEDNANVASLVSRTADDDWLDLEMVHRTAPQLTRNVDCGELLPSRNRRHHRRNHRCRRQRMPFECRLTRDSGGGGSHSYLSVPAQGKHSQAMTNFASSVRLTSTSPAEAISRQMGRCMCALPSKTAKGNVSHRQLVEDDEKKKTGDDRTTLDELRRLEQKQLQMQTDLLLATREIHRLQQISVDGASADHNSRGHNQRRRQSPLLLPPPPPHTVATSSCYDDSDSVRIINESTNGIHRTSVQIKGPSSDAVIAPPPAPWSTAVRVSVGASAQHQQPQTPSEVEPLTSEPFDMAGIRVDDRPQFQTSI